MQVAFPYQWFPRGDVSTGRSVVKDNKTLRPMVTATLINGTASLPFDALVDSGSDKTISFAEIGASLGIDFNDETFRKETETKTGMLFESEIFGLGKDPLKVFVTLIDIELLGHKQTVRMYWIKEKFAAGVDFALILGQDSIFSAFDIHFSKRQHKFFLNDKVFTP